MKKPTLYLFLLLSLLLALPAVAQEPVTDDEVNAVARDLYCPVCENTPLDVCPTQACQDWRDEIRMQLAQGKSEEEIQQYFVERYGPRVLAEPPREGFNQIVWLLPIAGVVIGAVLFGLYLNNLRKEGVDETGEVAQSTAPVPPPAADEDEYISRVEKELRE
mgnify:CR=1 FL=1